MRLKAHFLLRTAISHNLFHQGTDISYRKVESFGIIQSAIEIFVEFNG